MMLLLAVVAVASVSKVAATPVQKVVQLLNDMKEKGKQAKHDEQVQFATYKQFCEDTSRHKQQAVKDNNRRIDSLRAQIAENDADAKRLTTEVDAHERDISVFHGDKKAAGRVREIEHADFTALQTDYSESIDALERAIVVLKKQNFDRKQAAQLLQQIPVALPSESRRVIEAFLARDPEAETHLAVAAPKAHGYEFQSQGIVDLLEKLKNKFDDERESARKHEADSKHAFELLSQDLANQVDESSRQRNQKAETRALRQQSKGDATGELTDTIATRDDDQKYLTDLTATCEQKAADFEERQQLRADEIGAIEKAVQILSSEDVSGAASKHLPQDVTSGTSFLQLRQRGGDERERLAHFLKNQAEKINSRVLSMLALRVAQDPLKKVKQMIKDLIVRLMEEATQETEQKGWCDTELTNNEHTRKTKTSHVELLHANVDKLTASTATLTEDIATLNEQVTALNKAVAEALDMRSKEKERNQITIKDSQDAQMAVARAVAVLERFYAQAGEATSFVQRQQPESPAIFDSPYQGMQAENGGVLGMLEVIQSDFARLEAETTAAEAQAQKEHQEFLNDSAVDKTQKTKDIEHKTGSLHDQKRVLAETESDLVGTQKELDAALAYYETLKPQCIDSGVSYEERATRRKEEIESLQEALRILAGEEIA